MPFCPKCGKTIERGSTFCEEHTTSKLDIKPVEIRICECGRLFSNNKWFRPQNLEDSILRIIRHSSKQKITATIISFEEPYKRGQKTKGLAHVTFQSESREIPFTVKKQRCDKCAKMGTHYFTAKLQLRNPPEQALAFIQDYLRPLEIKGIAINKVEDTPRGPDLYLTHKSTARQLGEKLVETFGGSMKQSEQLFSRNKQTSKNLYRLNVVVEFAQFSVGDVVVYKEKPVLIKNLGKKCSGIDLSTGRKVIFIAEGEKLPIYKTTVSKMSPEIEVIHPETYQSVPAGNTAHVVDQKVNVVVFKDNVYII